MKPRELEHYVSLYKAGSSDAFDIIYQETQKSVYLSIYAIIKDRDTISDLMQDTYMKAINSFEQYKPNTNFNAWISTIAHNLAINYYNKNKKIDLADEVDEEYIFKDTSTSHSIVDQAMDILKDEVEREIFFMHIVLDTKFKDISTNLDIPLSTVFYIYKNALKKIKENL